MTRITDERLAEMLDLLAVQGNRFPARTAEHELVDALTELQTLRAAITSLIAERDGLREALRPLADLDGVLSDDDAGEFFRHDGTVLFISDIRRARALSLDTNKGDGE